MERVVVAMAGAYGPHERFFGNGPGAPAAERTLLHLCSPAMAEAIRVLVDAGAEIDARDGEGDTPLAAMVHASDLGSISRETLARLGARGLPFMFVFHYLSALSRSSTPIDEVLGVLEVAHELGAEPEGAAISLALRLRRRSAAERERIVRGLESLGHTSWDGVLEDVAGGGTFDQLVQALALRNPKPGAVHNDEKQTRLHIVCANLSSLDEELGEDEIVADRVRAIRWLRERGEPTNALDKRKRTPFDLYAKGRSELSAKSRRLLEAALAEGSPSVSAPRTLADAVAPGPLLLAVVNALLRGKQLKVAALTKRAKAKLAESSDDGADAREAAIIATFEELPLDGLDLTRVDTLTWDWGEPIFAWVDKVLGYENGGESDVLRLASLAGVQALPKLEALRLGGPHTYGGGVSDLAPLTAHPSIEMVELGLEVKLAKPLLSLPRLKTVVDSAACLSRADKRALEKRGVIVRSVRDP